MASNYTFEIVNVDDESDPFYEIRININKMYFTSYGGYLGLVTDKQVTFEAVNGVESDVSFEHTNDSIMIKIGGDWGDFSTSEPITNEVGQKFDEFLITLSKLSRY